MNIIRFQMALVATAATIMMGLGLEGVHPASAGSPAARTVSGEVVAVTPDASPQVIVVKAMVMGNKELVVGATLGAETIVTRGKKRVALSDIRVGETVSLTYVKNSDGLAAEKIHAR